MADHDFTKVSLTPSVILQVDTPESIEGSLYQGNLVHIYCLEGLRLPAIFTFTPCHGHDEGS